MANWATINGDIGYAYLRSGEFETVNEVVLARPDDPPTGCLNLRGLSPLTLSNQALVAAGPLPVASRSTAQRLGNGRRPATTALLYIRLPPPCSDAVRYYQGT